MSVVYYKGQQLGPDDLSIFLVDANDIPVDAAEITYALYDVTTGQEALLGVPRRTPAHPSVGAYYASIIIPLDANLGDYRIRWTFRLAVNQPIQSVVMQFAVVDKVTSTVSIYTPIEADFIRRLRILLRDLRPDRDYHFRPPAHEETVSQYNRVFGHIWLDDELNEFLSSGLDMVIAAPPRTPFQNIDQLAQTRPEWKTLVLTGAMVYALQALQINWAGDDFSVAPETDVTVRLPNGRRISLPIADLYAIVHDNGEP